MTHKPELGLFGDEECGGAHLAPAPAKGHCDQPGCGPDGKCCENEDCGECINDGHLDAPAKPAAPAKPKPAASSVALSPTARKRAVAEKAHRRRR